MSRFRLALVAGAILLLTPLALHACMWDYDTLQMERSRFPTTLELITGKFLRHSPEFYEWRVKDRLRRLETEPDNLALYDDLAVAYSKLGKHDMAIETILIKEKKKPGLYETYANLGTFYIFVGEWEKAVEYIDKAIAINPDAHFGRERYQKYLVEYLIKTRADSKLPMAAIGVSYLAAKPSGDTLRLPLSNGEEFNHRGFARYLCELDKNADTLENRQAAVKGILGMMKFAYYDMPVLLEVLGDVLCNMRREDAKQLAARAYLKAAMHTTDPDAKMAYRHLATGVLKQKIGYDGSQGMDLRDVEASFTAELNDANAWYSQLHDDEVRWLRERKNPEAEFDKLYANDPVVASPDDNKTIESPERGVVRLFLVASGLALVLVATAAVLACLVFWLIRRRNRRLALDESKFVPLVTTDRPPLHQGDERLHAL